MNTGISQVSRRRVPHQAHAPRAITRPRTLLRIGVVGLGYVGLPTAISLRQAGHDVVGLEANPDRLAAIRTGAVDLLPADLEALDTVVADDELVLTTDASLLTACDAVIVCVPTPVTERLVPDLAPLAAACETVVAHARPGQVVVLTSTTYVGCTRDLLVEPLRRRGLVAGVDVHVAFSPERIDPGVAGHQPATTPRVVGGLTPECLVAATRALRGTCPVLHAVSSPESAEMTKLLENTFRAVNIAMVNEFSDAARHLGLDITEVVDAAATKPYGFTAFRPGPGVGGHCIPCDPHYLLWQLRGEGVSTPVVEAAMHGIAQRPHTVVRRVRDQLADAGVPVAGARVHLVGVAYKPDVADVRESPALRIVEELCGLGAEVSYTDPLVPSVMVADGVLVHTELDEAVADVVLLHTRHSSVDLEPLRGQRVIDATYSWTAVGSQAL